MCLYAYLPILSQHGHPQEKINMGTTSIDPETWRELLTDLRERYTADKYHLLEYNCNTFSNECCEILVGQPIPARITSLPAEFLATPLGSMLRPQIDAMFSSRAGAQPITPAPAAAGPAPALLNTIATRAYAGNEEDNQRRAPTMDGAVKKGEPSKPHPHDKLAEQLSSPKSAAWTKAVTFDQKLNYRTVLSRIDAAIAAAPATISIQAKAELQDAGRTFRTAIIPPLELRGKITDEATLRQFGSALATVQKHLKTTTLFPFFELARDVALRTSEGANGEGNSCWCARAEPALRPVLRTLAQDKPKNEEGALIGVKTLQSGFRVIANGLAARLDAKRGFQEAVPIEDVLQLITEGLVTHPDVGVRESAASAAWNLILLDNQARGLLDVDTSCELFSALLEALKKADISATAAAGSGEVLVARALLKLLYKNPAWQDGLSDLFQVLEGPSIIKEKASQTVKGLSELSDTLKDLSKLCEFVSDAT